MNKRSITIPTIFLQAVIVLIGIGALAFLLWEPHVEGRNVNATLFEIYFNDPFLAYVYVASISFFVALYQAIKLLRYARTNKIFSQASVKALRTIRICATVLIVSVVVGEGIILPNADELPPPVFMGLLFTFGSMVIAMAASIFERILQDAISTPSENQLTVQ